MTTDQLSIFADPSSRRTDPDTSVAAAVSLPDLSALERLVLATFDRAVSLTDEELCEQLPDVYAPTLKSLRSRLKKRGLLVPTHSRRPSCRGREQIVWRRP